MLRLPKNYYLIPNILVPPKKIEQETKITYNASHSL